MHTVKYNFLQKKHWIL